MMRFGVYAALGGLALVLGHGLVLYPFHPRDAAADRTPPRQLRRAAARPGEATVLFAGDTAAVDEALPVLARRGLTWPFQLTVDLVRDADLAVVNVEAPITDGGDRFPVYKDYVYRAPARFADALAWAGFDVVELANNHAIDYGARGLDDTIAAVERAGLTPIGAGRDAAAARRAAIADIGGIRVGLLDYCERQLLWQLYVDQFARRGHAGVAMAAAPDVERDVARLRPQVDLLVVSLHMGTNYAPPTAAAVAWAERALDAGADLVVGHHPHVGHPVMLHRNKPALLSLGNYAFGTPGRPRLDYGWLAFAHVGGCGLDRVELMPLAVQNQRVGFRPSPLYDAELVRALERLRADSQAYGAALRLDLERGRAVLDVATRCRERRS